MNQKIDTAIRRTQQYNFEDGLTEVFIGALASLGGLVILTTKFPFVASGLFVVGVILITMSIERIRERYAYPRSGYLVYKEHKSKRWITILISIICAIIGGALIVSALILDPEHALAWAAPIVAAFIGGVFLYKGFQIHLARISFLGAFIIILGFLCSPIVLGLEATKGYNGISTFGLFLFLVGVTFLISGGLRFRGYLKENPLPVEFIDD